MAVPLSEYVLFILIQQICLEIIEVCVVIECVSMLEVRKWSYDEIVFKYGYVCQQIMQYALLSSCKKSH